MFEGVDVRLHLTVEKPPEAVEDQGILFGIGGRGHARLPFGSHFMRSPARPPKPGGAPRARLAASVVDLKFPSFRWQPRWGTSNPNHTRFSMSFYCAFA